MKYLLALIFIEGLTGTRFHPTLLLLGRLRYSVSLLWIDSFIYWLIHYIIKVKEIHYFPTNNRLWRTRLYEIGIIEKDICLFYGITGLFRTLFPLLWTEKIVCLLCMEYSVYSITVFMFI